jgi:hypothetical protein
MFIPPIPVRLARRGAPTSLPPPEAALLFPSKIQNQQSSFVNPSLLHQKSKIHHSKFLHLPGQSSASASACFSTSAIAILLVAAASRRRPCKERLAPCHSRQGPPAAARPLHLPPPEATLHLLIRDPGAPPIRAEKWAGRGRPALPSHSSLSPLGALPNLAVQTMFSPAGLRLLDQTGILAEVLSSFAR